MILVKFDGKYAQSYPTTVVVCASRLGPRLFKESYLYVWLYLVCTIVLQYIIIYTRKYIFYYTLVIRKIKGKGISNELG